MIMVKRLLESSQQDVPTKKKGLFMSNINERKKYDEIVLPNEYSR